MFCSFCTYKMIYCFLQPEMNFFEFFSASPREGSSDIIVRGMILGMSPPAFKLKCQTFFQNYKLTSCTYRQLPSYLSERLLHSLMLKWSCHKFHAKIRNSKKFISKIIQRILSRIVFILIIVPCIELF